VHFEWLRSVAPSRAWPVPVALQLNGGNDLSIVSSGAFAFATALQNGARYDVSVRTQPTNPSQTCTVSNGSGPVNGSNVTNIAISCVSRSFTVGGSVSGLAGSGLVVVLNGGNDLPIAAAGNFTFATPLPSGSQYRVRVATQPVNPTQVCTVAAGDGTMAARTSTSPHQLRIEHVRGLRHSRRVDGRGLVPQNNGADDVAVSADGEFHFPRWRAARLTTSLRTQPSDPSQSCTVTTRAARSATATSAMWSSCSTADYGGRHGQHLKGRAWSCGTSWRRLTTMAAARSISMSRCRAARATT
jgi:hypothetical protein